MSGWEPTTGQFPWPPANVTAMSAFHSSDTDLRWDDPSTVQTGPATPTTTASVSVTVAGNPNVLTAASGTLTLTGAPVTGTVEIGGVTLTAVAGVAGVDQFDGSSADPATVAANLAAAINSGSVGSWGIATAEADASVVTVTAGTAGTSGNTTTLSSTAPRIDASGTTLSGGLDADTLTLDSQVITAVAARTAGGMNFGVGPTNFNTAQSIADAINDTTNNLGFITATVDGDVVTIWAYLTGAMGDGITISTTNTTALVASDSQTRGGTGVPCPGKSNTQWTIVGVNVYRSETGERGPYYRVNNIPVASTFYRDRTNVVETTGEPIPWDGLEYGNGWTFRGDSPNSDAWRLRVKHQPIVKRFHQGDAIPANAPNDVEVYIDGVRAPVFKVFGQTGEIDLDRAAVWDPATETWSNPPTPTATSSVTVNYHWMKSNKLVGDLDKKAKVFYRVTTVAIDESGESSTGLVETPLGYCEPISPINSEKLDYVWKEAIRRNRWILEQGGERVKLFIRRVTGVPCQCVWDPRLEAYSKQPMNQCLSCYGTGWVGGYEGPIDIIVGPDDSERRVAQTPNGRRLEHVYEVWIGPSPMLSQRDFIVKQNGERYSIGPVRRTQVRGLVLQQSFQIGYLDTGDIRYQVPMGSLERLPWPETRVTNPEDSPCEEADPHPLGYDYQATPMMSETPKIPDGREKRGRTPVWQNIMYGGKGSGNS